MRKSSTTLTLLEQIIMILVFAVAAAVSLRVFVYADSRSERNVVNDVAVNESRNVAEVLKSTGGDFEKAAGLLQAAPSEKGLEKGWSNEYGSFFLSAEKVSAGTDGLGSAEIRVKNLDTDEQVYAITVFWQEAMP